MAKMTYRVVNNTCKTILQCRLDCKCYFGLFWNTCKNTCNFASVGFWRQLKESRNTCKVHLQKSALTLQNTCKLANAYIYALHVCECCVLLPIVFCLFN